MASLVLQLKHLTLGRCFSAIPKRFPVIALHAQVGAIADALSARRGASAGTVRALRSALIASMATVVVAAPSQSQPVHKAVKRSQPASTAHASPDVTATIPSPNSKGSSAGTTASKDIAPSTATTGTRLANLPDPTAPDTDPLPPDFKLPTASRAQMRECGLRWHQMKLDGTAGEDIWRDFAVTCLKSAKPASVEASGGAAEH